MCFFEIPERGFSNSSKEKVSFFLQCDYPKHFATGVYYSWSSSSTITSERLTDQPTILLVLFYHPLYWRIKSIMTSVVAHSLYSTRAVADGTD